MWILNSPCRVEGRGSFRCRPPTGNWDPLYGQRVHWRPCGCRPWSRHILLNLWRLNCEEREIRNRNISKSTQKHGASATKHLPRDREDSIDDGILGVLCCLYVNISYKWRVKTVLQEEEFMLHSTALFSIYIYTAFSQSIPSSAGRPSGYMTLEAKPTFGWKHLEPSLGFG